MSRRSVLKVHGHLRHLRRVMDTAKGSISPLVIDRMHAPAARLTHKIEDAGDDAIPAITVGLDHDDAGLRSYAWEMLRV